MRLALPIYPGEKRCAVYIGCKISHLFLSTVDEESQGFGCCGWFLTVVSWFLIGVTFPFSLCVCLRVSLLSLLLLLLLLLLLVAVVVVVVVVVVVAAAAVLFFTPGSRA